MPTLPAKYAWLAQEPGPVMLRQAIALYGTIEFPGAKSNPVIMDWAEECGLDETYSSDAIAWCGLFVAVCARRATWVFPNNPLWALNWSTWGSRQTVAMLGDVMVFKRPGGGHVAIYVGEDDTHYHILGGNQSDKVCIVRRAKKDTKDYALVAIRRPIWRIAQPANVRRVFLSASGTPLAGSEA